MGGSQPRYSNVPEPSQPLANCSRLKEALCEGQTDGHRMKTIMILPAPPPHTHTHTATCTVCTCYGLLWFAFLCVFKDETGCCCGAERWAEAQQEKGN